MEDKAPSPERLLVLSSEVFLEHDTGAGHPERALRLERVLAALRADESLRERIEWATPRAATDIEILRCHSREHLARIEAARGRSGRLDADTVHSPRSVEAARLAAGAAIEAAERCWNGTSRCALSLARPPGHHATPDRAMGFCFFNSAAIAARHVQALGCKRVLIVDWDVHHGNGTQEIFWDDASVFYYSLHQSPLYPGTGSASETGVGDGDGATLNRPLPAGYPRAEYRRLFERDIDEIARRFAPEFAIISAGFDSHRDDPLGSLLLEDDDFAELTRIVAARVPANRVAGVLEGGYDVDALARSVRAHAAALSACIG